MNFIKKFLSKFELLKGVLSLLTGTTVSQLLPILISPLITRLYTPESFGILGVFVSISTILGSIANCRYELAIVLPKEDEEALNIVALSIAVASLYCMLLLIIICLFHNTVVRLVRNDAIALWLYLVPLIVFIIGIHELLNFYNLRKKKYKNIVKSTIIKAATLAVVQIAVGFLRVGAFGLILGRFAFRIMGNIILGKTVIHDARRLKNISLRGMLHAGKRYSNFLKFSVWARLANTISLRVNNLLISNLFSIGDVGFYSLTTRVLNRPGSLLGRTIGKVYYVQATEEKKKTGVSSQTFRLSFVILFLVGIVVYGTLFFTVKEIFLFVFGDKWILAGEYARIMMPLFFIRFLVSPLSNTNNVFEKQNISFLWQTGLLIATLSVYFFAKYFKFSIEQYLYLYTGFHSALYIALGIIVFILSRRGSLRSINNNAYTDTDE